jgi:hypothetical protein
MEFFFAGLFGRSRREQMEIWGPFDGFPARVCYLAGQTALSAAALIKDIRLSVRCFKSSLL